MTESKYILLDIGVEQTKLIEVEMQHDKCVILGTYVMSDMNNFITDAGGDRVLTNMEAFALSLKDTLDKFKISARKVLICSEAFKISAVPIEWGDMTVDTKQVLSAFEASYGRKTNNIKIYDWQAYGNSASEKEIKTRVILSNCEIHRVTSFFQALLEHGLLLVGFESCTTAILNRMQLRKVKFDLPTHVYVDFGTRTRYFAFKNGVHVLSEALTLPINSLASQMAKSFNLPEARIKYIVSRIGFCKDSNSETELRGYGLNPKDFFDTLYNVVRESVEQLASAIASTAETRNYGNYCISLTGSVMDVKGAFEFVQSVWKNVPIIQECWDTDDVITSTVHLVNKTNAIIGSKYSTLIGLCCKHFLKKSTNLVPAELMKSRVELVVENAVKWCKWIPAVACAIMFIITGMSCTSLAMYSKLDTYMTQAQQEVKKLEREKVLYDTYITEMKNLDNALMPLMDLVTQYGNTSLRIASIDTKGMIPIPVILNSGDNASNSISDSTVSGESSGSAPTSETNESSELADDISSQDKSNNASTEGVGLGEVKQDLVIRGYSLDAEAVTRFYADLNLEPWVQSLDMVGLEQVTLPSDEQLYIFEMNVGR